VLRRALGVTGCEGVSAAANVFVGMVEAPLFIWRYLARRTRGELFCVMTCGMATIFGTVMILYARILVPESKVEDSVDVMAIRSEAHGRLGAIVRGTTDGVQIAINVDRGGWP
jgi:nucleoside permease NupC